MPREKARSRLGNVTSWSEHRSSERRFFPYRSLQVRKSWRSAETCQTIRALLVNPEHGTSPMPPTSEPPVARSTDTRTTVMSQTVQGRPRLRNVSSPNRRSAGNEAQLRRAVLHHHKLSGYFPESSRSCRQRLRPKVIRQGMTPTLNIETHSRL
jgi:hypothetical protein